MFLQKIVFLQFHISFSIFLFFKVKYQQMSRFCFQCWNSGIALAPVPKIPFSCHFLHDVLDIAKWKHGCVYVQLPTGVFYSQACWKHVPACLLASALLIHAWLDWTHTYLHLTNTEVSCVEWRRGHRSSSGVSCVAVCCVEIRCLSLDRRLFTALFLEMEKRWRFYFTAVISVWLGAAPGDTSSSSLCLIQRGMLMTGACSVSGLLFLLLLWEERLHLSMSKMFCLHGDSFLKVFFASSLLQCQTLITPAVFLSRLEINELPVSGRKCRLKVAQSISWRGGQPWRKWADTRNLIPQKCIEYESQEVDRLL